MAEDGKIGLGEMPKCRPADAVTLMVHHLMLASVYYEAASEGDTEAALASFKDELIEQVGSLEKNDPAWQASIEFWKWLDHGHAEIAKELER